LAVYSSFSLEWAGTRRSYAP